MGTKRGGTIVRKKEKFLKQVRSRGLIGNQIRENQFFWVGREKNNSYQETRKQPSPSGSPELLDISCWRSLVKCKKFGRNRQAPKEGGFFGGGLKVFFGTKEGRRGFLGTGLLVEVPADRNHRRGTFKKEGTCEKGVEARVCAGRRYRT